MVHAERRACERSCSRETHASRGESTDDTLRQRMIEDMQIRDYSKHTIAAYVSAVYRLANSLPPQPRQAGSRRDPGLLWSIWSSRSRCPGRTTSRCWRRCGSSIVTCFAAAKSSRTFAARGREKRLPVVLSGQEVARFFKAIPSLKHRTILMLAYGAGLRIGEAVRVRVSDIDRQRKVIRVQQGKGKKDRYTMLSPALLEMLDRYCWAARPEDLLFTSRCQGPADHRQHGAAGLHPGAARTPASTSGFHRTRCATVLPRICWKQGPTCG